MSHIRTGDRTCSLFGCCQGLHLRVVRVVFVCCAVLYLHLHVASVSRVCWAAKGLGVLVQVSLEMDGESEDETEALADMYDPERTSDGTQRFALLRELWASAR